MNISSLKFVLLPFLSLFFLHLPAKANKSIDAQAYKQLEKWAEATDFCSRISRKRDPIDQETLQQLAALESSEMRNFLIYRSLLSHQRCVEDRTGIPLAYGVQIGLAPGVSWQARSLIFHYLTLMTEGYTIDLIDKNSNSWSPALQTLNKSRYLSHPFNLIEVHEKITKHKNEEMNIE